MPGTRYNIILLLYGIHTSIPSINFHCFLQLPPTPNSDPGSHITAGISHPPFPLEVRVLTFIPTRDGRFHSLLDSRRLEHTPPVDVTVFCIDFWTTAKSPLEEGSK